MANEWSDSPVTRVAKPRRVLLSGAGGRLGRVVLPVLRGAGHQVAATDVRGGQGDAGFRVANLLEESAVRQMMDGCDAVVHLGNHAGWMNPPPAQLFNENVAMTMNVFTTARMLGIRRIIYASSIQVIASEWLQGYGVRAPRVAYLPMDGNSPADPTNSYALSKLVGEMTLAQWASEIPLEAVSLRFPMLVDLEDSRTKSRRAAGSPAKELSPVSIAQGFSWLTYRDAAELVRALLAMEWTGARVYMPVSPRPGTLESVEELVEKHYRGVPRKAGHEGPLAALVDISAITRETGWARAI